MRQIGGIWGRFFEISTRTLSQSLRGLWRWDGIAKSIVQTGIESLPIVTISTAFTGLVVTNEIAWHLDLALHNVSMIPGLAGQFILRELGVVIPALLVVSNVGAATTAELGSMKVTEQIDALQLLGVDPVNFLVVPRFIAGIGSMLCLTVIAIFVTLICALAVGVFSYHFGWLEYLTAIQHFISIKDIICAMIKALVFGAVIPLISCTFGFECGGGAEGVGTATTNSVVTATLAVISLDFLLTYLSTLLL